VPNNFPYTFAASSPENIIPERPHKFLVLEAFFDAYTSELPNMMRMNGAPDSTLSRCPQNENPLSGIREPFASITNFFPMVTRPRGPVTRLSGEWIVPRAAGMNFPTTPCFLGGGGRIFDFGANFDNLFSQQGCFSLESYFLRENK